MESSDSTSASQSSRLQADASINRPSSRKDDGKDLSEKMKKIEVKPPSSPTSFLARNAVLVPSQVARLKEISPARTGLQIGAPNASVVSSGSATGKYRWWCYNLR